MDFENPFEPPESHETLVETEAMHGRRRDGWLILAVLCIAVVPNIFYPLAEALDWTNYQPSYAFGAFEWIVWDMSTIAAVLAIARLDGGDWKSIGIVPVRWVPDVIMGLGVWLAGYAVLFVLASVVPRSAYHVESWPVVPMPTRGTDYAVGVAKSCTAGFTTALVLSGFLITYLERWFRSTRMALLITSLLAASFLVGYPALVMFEEAVVGLIYGGAFCLFRRLWPIAIAYAFGHIFNLLTG